MDCHTHNIRQSVLVLLRPAARKLDVSFWVNTVTLWTLGVLFEEAERCECTAGRFLNRRSALRCRFGSAGRWQFGHQVITRPRLFKRMRAHGLL